ncbi:MULTISPECIES: ThiF family adenylyltransferase [unclassified Hymenobacter]|uniref:Thiamine biosynthesis protein ThiF n=1 Tax=Hymenobacter metallilatus TaxID=2493666 RepID=A0A428IZ78_9BACT|nr:MULTISPECIES: ThiF family adenylyltransferase [unclassified Hymenobacter]AII54508.1 hypothetical protein N008_21520 [Hymenobacter sp. APR13]RSK24564.1 thiamine biosynthesis protein ThiF [Hymenobacter metallilatus]
MARKLFSHFLRRDKRPITNPRLEASLRELASHLGVAVLKPLAWDNDHIGLALTVAVELPPRGNYAGIDIRAQEPVLLVLSRTGYPTATPVVYADRLDFPKDQLAHLYVAVPGKPPAFCLVRGDFTEWYANRRLPDVVTRTQNWLRDAVTGELAVDGQQFDPLRLEGYQGSVIYPYDHLAQVVLTRPASGVANFSVALFENTAPVGTSPAFRLDRLVTPENIEEIVEEFLRGMRAVAANSLQARRYHAGYVVWSPADTTYSDYCVDLPRSWQKLLAFGQSFGIDFGPLERHLAVHDINFFPEVPVLCALKRPKPLIGFTANLEFVNFYLTLQDTDKDPTTGRIINDLPVSFQVHNEPLTLQKAQVVSGAAVVPVGSIWVAGCGALGSKVVMHFARGGITDFVLLDPDKLSPHNLVRHTLFAQHEGLNKALALEQVIREMYRYETGLGLIALARSADFVLAPVVGNVPVTIQRVFDFTASEAFFHTLLASPILAQTVISRGLISDQGQLGILSLEGANRNPRLDDLQTMLYAEYAHRPAVAAWLAREVALAQTDGPLLSVGIGCNSETTVLADETISTHAAYFAEVLKQDAVVRERPVHGQVFLSRVAIEDGYPSISTERLVVEPMHVFNAVNDASWQVRMTAAVLQTIKQELALAAPHETGGVFIGRANFKTKTIHVVGVVPAPPDSRANSVCFFRGVQNLPETVNKINQASGGQLGYIGEWHTHPVGPECMSPTDAATVQRFQQEFADLTSPLPVFLLIATPSAILPFVY